MNVAAAGSALPPHRYPQQQIRDTVRALWRDQPDALRRLESLHEHVSVKERHLALPLERYLQLASFTESNDEYIAAGAYTTKGPASAGTDCYWARMREASGGTESIIANDLTAGRAIVTLGEGEFFKTSGCKPWTAVTE